MSAASSLEEGPQQDIQQGEKEKEKKTRGGKKNKGKTAEQNQARFDELREEMEKTAGLKDVAADLPYEPSEGYRQCVNSWGYADMDNGMDKSTRCG